MEGPWAPSSSSSSRKPLTVLWLHLLQRCAAAAPPAWAAPLSLLDGASSLRDMGRQVLTEPNRAHCFRSSRLLFSITQPSLIEPPDPTEPAQARSVVPFRSFVSIQLFRRPLVSCLVSLRCQSEKKKKKKSH